MTTPQQNEQQVSQPTDRDPALHQRVRSAVYAGSLALVVNIMNSSDFATEVGQAYLSHIPKGGNVAAGSAVVTGIGYGADRMLNRQLPPE